MKIKILLSVLLLMLFAAKARAWNATGHMTVAELAWRSLSSGERTKISILLRQHPHYAELLAAEAPAEANLDEWVFLRASIWPDLVRPAYPGKPPKPTHITDYNRPSWHFSSIPFVTPADLATIKLSDHPPTETNIVERLPVVEATLKSPQTSPSERAVALAWYLHLMGDLHQPLHCATWISPEYPKGDRGGNEVAIQPRSAAVKLHAFWDDALGTGETYTFIAFQADQIQTNPQLAKSQLKELKSHQTYPLWAEESFDLAKSFGYLNGEIEHTKYHEGIASADVPGLNPGYEENMHIVSRRRVALAGIRLGKKLKAIF